MFIFFDNGDRPRKAFRDRMINLLPNHLHIERKIEKSPGATLPFLRNGDRPRKVFHDRNNNQKCDRKNIVLKESI